MPSVHLKRPRLETAASSKDIVTAGRPTHSRIFAPFRSIGHTTSSTPPALLPLGATFQISTALPHTVQTYDVRKLNLLFVTSPATPGVISRVVAHKDVVYAAFDGGVWVFKRGRKIAELEMPAGGKGGSWIELIVFGEWIVGAQKSEGRIVVWRRETGEVHTVLEMGGAGEVVAVAHPSTYLNKIVVGKKGGDVEIWNVKTGKNIYTILSPLPAGKAITTIVQSPALDIVAIGYATGEIHLHNLRYDTPLFTLNTRVLAASAATKRVTSLTFCTDPFVGAGQSSPTNGSGRVLAAGHDDGYVTLWNLETRKLAATMRHAHEPSSSGVHATFLQGQNVLLTSAADNAIKSWVFDSPHSTRPRLQSERAGHSAPVSALIFVAPGQSHFLLSASRDRSLRAISLRSDAQAFEFSQGKDVSKAKKAVKMGAKGQQEAFETTKAGPITCIATCAGEDGLGSTGRDWEGIVTGHAGERAARTWSWKDKKLGRWALPTTDGGAVKAVAISACGTFALVGSSKGGVDMFNLQSGMHRGRFPAPLTPAQAKLVKNGNAVGKLAMMGRGRHTTAITGLASDALNRVVYTSSLDGMVKSWEFTTGILLHTYTPPSTPSALKLHRSSTLLAISCDDAIIRVLDTETHRLVRELHGAGGHVTDFCFSPDARWVVASSTDGVVRVWDLPTGHCVDAVRTTSIASAVAFAGEYLATAHTGDVGVALWTNRTLFRHVPTRAIDESDIVALTLPSVSGAGGVSAIDGAFSSPSDDDDGEEAGVYPGTPNQLDQGLLTMSTLPRSRWTTLLHLDAIRARNKPTEAPKAPEKAPFFLGALAGMKDPVEDSTTRLSAFLPSITDPTITTTATISRITTTTATTSSDDDTLSTALHDTTGCALVQYLKTLSPASTDLTIRSLRTQAAMVSFVAALTARVVARQDWELGQAWMARFLAVHAAVIAGDDEEEGGMGIGMGIGIGMGMMMDGDGDGDEEKRGVELRQALDKWKQVQDAEQSRLVKRVGFCLGVAEFLRSGR